MSQHQTKYVFVTGGVVSSLGKGVTTAALGRLLKGRGVKVSILKIDPYINVDPGTMNPYEHGEVFVTADGAETDQDLGHYERFIDEELVRESNFTTGQVYQTLIERERKGDFLGKTVEEVPHVTDEIIRRIEAAAEKTKAEVLLVELGSTIGDIKGMAFLEAFRQLRNQVGRHKTMSVHVSLLPHLGTTEELKTRPAQYSVKELRSYGLPTHILVARADKPIPDAILEKLAVTCDVRREAVVPMSTTKNVYDVPVRLESIGLWKVIKERLELPDRDSDLRDWAKMVDKTEELKREDDLEIAIVGKYVELNDAYISVSEAVKAAALQQSPAGRGVKIRWVNSEDVEKEGPRHLDGVDGVVVPGGFGDRGVEGKIMAATWCRENKVPYLGLCLGMQVLTIEFARHVLGDDTANSAEFDLKTKHPVIHLMESQQSVYTKGGTMRLGNCPCKLAEGSLAWAAYEEAAGETTGEIVERHRHRYEFNNDYREQLAAAGLRIAGTTPDDVLVEIVEIADHPFMVGSQFHPEFKSRPDRAHPLFSRFIKAAVKRTAPAKQTKKA
ncbi:MAG: CTP synthase [bacterium]|nr:CTP synthase [bacterium]MDZ4247666.1 CTP synthase [Patescibacteria group bacterium]